MGRRLPANSEAIKDGGESEFGLPEVAMADDVARYSPDKPLSLEEASDVMTADEVAVVLRVDRKTVYDSFKRGELPGVHLGRLIRFYRADVINWLRGNGSVPRSSRRRK